MKVMDEVIQARKEQRRNRHESANEFNKNMFFYYLRGKDRQIFGGVCLKKIDQNWCRGISLLCNQDSFDKNFARRLARNRLMRAVCSKISDLPVKRIRQGCQDLYHYYLGFQKGSPDGLQICKAQFDAMLTEKEKEMVSEPF